MTIQKDSEIIGLKFHFNTDILICQRVRFSATLNKSYGKLRPCTRNGFHYPIQVVMLNFDSVYNAYAVEESIF